MEKKKKHKNLIFFQAKKIKINLWKNYYTLLQYILGYRSRMNSMNSRIVNSSSWKNIKFSE